MIVFTREPLMASKTCRPIIFPIFPLTIIKLPAALNNTADPKLESAAMIGSIRRTRPFGCATTTLPTEDCWMIGSFEINSSSTGFVVSGDQLFLAHWYCERNSPASAKKWKRIYHEYVDQLARRVQRVKPEFCFVSYRRGSVRHPPSKANSVHPLREQ